ncbi:MAG TPA: hypothetical protein DCM40_37735, partial [Maribacter sp.]|nr:hypothetical protein [Maribacter sp.]
IPRVFDLTSKITGSSQNPNISESGDTFTNIPASGTIGTTESGIEQGSTITVAGHTIGITGSLYDPTISTAAFHINLSQSIKDQTEFDTISVTDLGNGFFKFALTASITGSGPGGVLNSSIARSNAGSRTTFRNLIGTNGGTLEAGAE